MIPTAKFIADFHRPVIAHAGRTKKIGRAIADPALLKSKLLSLVYLLNPYHQLSTALTGP
jgi:hypothetical protein